MSIANTLAYSGPVIGQARQPKICGAESLVRKYLSECRKQLPMRRRFARLLIASGEYDLNQRKAGGFFAKYYDTTGMLGGDAKTDYVVLRKMADDFVRQNANGWRLLYENWVAVPHGRKFFNDETVAGTALSIMADELGGAEKITKSILEQCFMDGPLKKLAGGKCPIEKAMELIPGLIEKAKQAIKAPKNPPLSFDPALPPKYAVIREAVLTGRFRIDASKETFSSLQEFALPGERMNCHSRAAPMELERLRGIAKGMAESGSERQLEALYRLYLGKKLRLTIDFRLSGNRMAAKEELLKATGGRVPAQEDYESNSLRTLYYWHARLFGARLEKGRAQAELPAVAQDAPLEAAPFFKAHIGPKPAKPRKKREKPEKSQEGGAGMGANGKAIDRETIHMLALEQQRKAYLEAREAEEKPQVDYAPKLRGLGWSPSMETPENGKKSPSDLQDMAKKVRTYCYYRFMEAAAEIDVVVVVRVAGDTKHPYLWESQPHRKKHDHWVVIDYKGSESGCHYSFNEGESVKFNIADLDRALAKMMGIAADKIAVPGRTAHP